MSEARRVLIFIDHFLPGYKAGGPVRSCANMIEHLKDRYSFFVLTRDREYMEERPYVEVERDAWNQREGYQVFYASDRNLSKKAICRRIEEVDPHTVYINGVYSFRFSILPLWIIKRMSHPPRTVIAPRGMLAPGAMSIKPWKKRSFLHGARLMGLFKGTVFHATHGQELQEIRKWIGDPETWTLANLPPFTQPADDPGVEKKPGELKLVSIARIAPEKNTLELLRSLAEFGQEGIRLDLFGPIYDKGYWEKCLEVIEQMPEGVKVEHTDGIPPNRTTATIRDHHAFVLLTKGENFGHAILESLIAGRPVIISDRTPWSKVEQDGMGYVVSLEKREQIGNAIEALREMGQEAFDRSRLRIIERAEKLKEGHGLKEAYQHLLES